MANGKHVKNSKASGKNMLKEMTTLDIIDTAVKIGFGALISGATAYVITRLKYRSDLNKELLSRRQVLLERVANQVEELNRVYLKYYASMLNFIRDKKEGIEWSGYEKDEHKEVTKDLNAGFQELTSAEAKLLLLGETDAYDTLRTYGTKIHAFTQKVVYGNRENLEERDIVSLMNEIREARINFYRVLSQQFKTTNVSSK